MLQPGLTLLRGSGVICNFLRSLSKWLTCGSENRFHFLFNVSLTSINIAKAIHCLSISEKDRGEFSMSNIKTMNHNVLMLKQIF